MNDEVDPNCPQHKWFHSDEFFGYDHDVTYYVGDLFRLYITQTSDGWKLYKWGGREDHGWHLISVCKTLQAAKVAGELML